MEQHANVFEICFSLRLSLDSTCAVTACESLYLINRYHIEVAFDGVLEAGCRNCEFNSVLSGVTVEAGVDKTAAEAIAAADSVNDVHVIGLREAVLLAVVKKSSPVVIVSADGGTEGYSNLLEAELLLKLTCN